MAVFLSPNMFDNGNAVNPPWCDYVPFSDFFSACKPETQAQQQARIASELSTTQLSQQQIADTLAASRQTITQDMTANPSAYADYNAATEFPTTSAIISPNAAGYLFGQTGANGEPSTSGNNFVTLAILATIGIIVLNKVL